MDKYIGRLLDNRYEILEVLGSGGMAVVYKARCHRLNRLVAIKILKDDNLEDEDFKRRFHAESQAVAMLSHPNIVSVYDVSTSAMADYIVMELIEGITLKQYMEKKGSLNWKETLHFATQIAKALDHAHSRGIVHRDIKPHNVMVLKNGSVKVTDFGIARLVSKGNTLTKEALGSVHYISPEQAKGGRVDTRSDIYSLGAVMYEMMTGRPPYDGDSPVSVAIQHINGGAIMPSILNANIPGGLEQIIMKAMAHEIGKRYESAAQMLADMDEFRKDPTVLFDYNAPPLDDVLQMPKPTPIPPLERPATAPKRPASQTGRQKKVVPEKPQKPATPPAHRKPAQEQSNSRASMIAIIACAIVAFVAIVIFLFVLLGGLFNGGVSIQIIEAPRLVDQYYSELPEYENIKIIHKLVYDNVHKEGIILSQDPAPGEKMAVGETIIITVSKGPSPEVIRMEDLTQMSEAQAKRELDKHGLNLKVVVNSETSDTVAKGNVIRTVPAEGTVLNEEDTVTLYISSGYEMKSGVMPDLLGVDITVATETLSQQSLHLDILVEEVYDSNVPKGQVIAQSPEKNTMIFTGDTITLRVSLGPELAYMLNVVGWDIQTAVSNLVTAGFKTPTIELVPSDKEINTVVAQSHQGDTMIDINSNIVLQVSSGPSGNTKDVTVDVSKWTAEKDCTITIFRDEEVVFNQLVAQGTQTVLLAGQVGTGNVYYEISVDGEPAEIIKVNFNA